MDLINNYIIFSVDNWSDVHFLAKFTRHIDTLYATQKLKVKPKTLIGSYMGQFELSFMMEYHDYYNEVDPTNYVFQQETVLRINPANPRTAVQFQGTIVNRRDGSEHFLGRMFPMPATSTPEENCWTYVPADGSGYDAFFFYNPNQ